MRIPAHQQKLGRALEGQHNQGALGRQSREFLARARDDVFLDSSAYGEFESYKMGGTMSILGEDQAWEDLSAELQGEIESSMRTSDLKVPWVQGPPISYGIGQAREKRVTKPSAHVYRRTGDQTGRQRFESAVAQGAKVFDEKRRTPAPNTEYQKRTVSKGGRSILAR